MQRDVLDVVEELRVERLVEPELVPDVREHLRARLTARAQRRGVAGREDVEDDEGQQADQDQQDDAPEKATDDVSGHWWGPVLTARCRGRPEGRPRRWRITTSAMCTCSRANRCPRRRRLLERSQRGCSAGCRTPQELRRPG